MISPLHRVVGSRQHESAEDAKVYLLASIRNYKKPGVTFRALLTEGGAERLELVRAQRALGARLQNGIEELASIRNYKTLNLRFRDLLGEGIPDLCFELA